MSPIDDLKIIILLLFALVLRSGAKTFYFAIVYAYVQEWCENLRNSGGPCLEALRNTIIVLSKLVESWALVWHPDPTNSVAEILKLLALFKVASTQNLEIARLYRAQHPSTPTPPPNAQYPTKGLFRW